MDLYHYINTIHDWPKKGVSYRDIFPILHNPLAFKEVTQLFRKYCEGKDISKIAGIESRGFIFAAALAQELNLPLILIRKRGKLPGKTLSKEYQLEYGRDAVEIQEGSVVKGDRLLIVDDQIATGGTAYAASQLIEAAQGNVSGFAFVINQEYGGGSKLLEGYSLCSLITFKDQN